MTDLEAIDKAIASGALRVRFSNMDVTYQSMEDLLKARKLILAKEQSGERRSVVFSVATFDE